MRKGKISAVILSAGYSSRMEEFKPLLRFGGYTAVETVINTFKNAGVDEIILVSGFRYQEVMNATRYLNVKCVVNENYSKGMFSSILKGVEALGNTDAFMMLPVDIPLVKEHTVKAIIEKYYQEDKGIIYPVFFDEKGHPPLIDCRYRDIIMKSSGDGGLKKILEDCDDDSLCVQVPDEAVLMDMDTKDEYERMLDYYNSLAPNNKECDAILKIYNICDNIIRHSEKVAQTALGISDILNTRGCNLNRGTLYAAAVLHDIARGSSSHERVGALILKELGYAKVADIISGHMDIKVNESDNISEKEILYIADKIVSGDQIITIKERFEKCMDKYSDNPEALTKISSRYDQALKIAAKIEKITGETFLYR